MSNQPTPRQARDAVHAATERVRRAPDPTNPEWLAALDELSRALDVAKQVDPAAAVLNEQPTEAAPAIADQQTYAIRGAKTKMTGHYRQPGTRLTYCNRPIGSRNEEFRILPGWRMCKRCETAEARDHAEAAAVAEEHREDTTAEPAAASTWRSDWIGARDENALFTLPSPAEQGALFA